LIFQGILVLLQCKFLPRYNFLPKYNYSTELESLYQGILVFKKISCSYLDLDKCFIDKLISNSGEIGKVGDIGKAGEIGKV
jgi:hypothetical protein